MYQRRVRRFRRRPNDRTGFLHGNGNEQVRSRSNTFSTRSNTFSNGPIRNKFRATLSAEKLFEKYNVLAKEAMSSGDKTLSENYFQHADHFIRIIENKNINQKQNSVQTDDKLDVNAKPLVENSSVNQDKTIEEKEEKEEKKE